MREMVGNQTENQAAKYLKKGKQIITSPGTVELQS
jgi:hypothetical protein